MLYLAHRGIWRGGDVENTLSAFDRVVDRVSPNLGLLQNASGKAFGEKIPEFTECK